jgi:hypothetical protein
MNGEVLLIGNAGVFGVSSDKEVTVGLRFAVSGGPKRMEDVLGTDLIIFVSIYLLKCQSRMKLLIACKFALQKLDLP